MFKGGYYMGYHIVVGIILSRIERELCPDEWNLLVRFYPRPISLSTSFFLITI